MAAKRASLRADGSVEMMVQVEKNEKKIVDGRMKRDPSLEDAKRMRGEMLGVSGCCCVSMLLSDDCNSFQTAACA